MICFSPSVRGDYIKEEADSDEKTKKMKWNKEKEKKKYSFTWKWILHLKNNSSKFGLFTNTAKKE